MVLKENIEQELEELLNKVNNNKIETETIEKLERIIAEITENVENLDRVELAPYLDNIYNNHSNIKEIKQRLEVLKKLAVAHRKMGGDFFSFDNDQKEFIKKVCFDAKEFVKKTRQKSSYVSQIKIYEDVLNKMKNNEKLSTNDLKFIIEFLKGKSPEEMKFNLLDFYKYNLEAENLRKSKDIEDITPIQKNAITEEEIEKRTENVKNKVNKYGNFKDKHITSQVKKHNLEIGTFVNLENAEKVLETLADLEILDKFDIESVLALIIYATPETIKEAYDEFNGSNKNYKCDVIYKFPSLWTKQGTRNKSDRVNSRYKKHGGPDETQNNISLESAAKMLYRKELYEKFDFYKNNGLGDIVSGKNIAEAAIKPTLESLKRKLEDFRLYDVKPTGSCFSLVSDVKRECDKAVECNLLTPGLEYKTYENYVNNNPTFLTNIKEKSVLYAESLLGTGKEKSIFSTYNYKEPRLKLSFREGKIDDDKIDPDMVKTDSSNMFRYNEMEKVTLEEEKTLDLLQEDFDFIQELDAKYKESDYKYIIDNSIISRLKVIRKYNLLKYYNNTLSKEKKLSEEEIRLFAITYDTYIKEHTYEKIKDIVRNKGGRIK